MKQFFIFLIIICAISCQQKPTVQFDQVDFYRIKFNQEEENKILVKRDSVSKSLWNVINDDVSLTNIATFYDLNTLDRSVNILIAKSLENEKVELEEASFLNVSLLCDPFYRDILVFKKNGDTTAIAKICFNCEQNNFVAGNKDYRRLKLNYQKIEKLLDSVASH